MIDRLAPHVVYRTLLNVVVLFPLSPPEMATGRTVYITFSPILYLLSLLKQKQIECTAQRLDLINPIEVVQL